MGSTTITEELMHALDATRCRKRDLHPRKAGDEDAAYLRAELKRQLLLRATGHSGGRGYLLQLGQSLHLACRMTERKCPVRQTNSPKSSVPAAHGYCLFQQRANANAGSCISNQGAIILDHLMDYLQETNPFRL